MLDEVQRRREIQRDYNERQGIVPRQIVKQIAGHLVDEVEAVSEEGKPLRIAVEKDIGRQIKRLEMDMVAAAKSLEFERAAEMRDAIAHLKRHDLGVA